MRDENKKELVEREEIISSDTAIKFKESLVAFESFIKTLLNTLELGVDYGQPYPGAPYMTLLLPGAEKICAFFGINVTERGHNFIKKGDEIFGVEVALTLKKGSRSVDMTAIACYDEKRFFDREGNPLPLYFLYTRAYKRAFVKGVITMVGLSKQFVTEEEEETIKEEREKEEKPISKEQIDGLIKYCQSKNIKEKELVQYVKEKYNKQLTQLTQKEYQELVNEIKKRKEEEKKDLLFGVDL